MTIVDQLPQEDLTYSPQPNEIIFASAENASILVSLLDGQFNTLSQLVLKSGGDCLAGLTQWQIALLNYYGQYYSCLLDNFTLVSSTNPNSSVSLYIDNTQFQSNQLGVFHFSPPLVNPYYRPIDPPIQIDPDQNPSSNPFYQ